MLDTAASTTISVDDVDLGDPDFWAQPPHERDRAFAVLRAHRPVSFHRERPTPGLIPGAGFWALVRHADILGASRYNDKLSNAQGVFIPDLRASDPRLMAVPQNMLNVDDPDHARLRAVVAKAFTHKAIRELKQSVEASVTEILNDVAPLGECDFVSDIAGELPMRVIGRMTGIPYEDYPEVLRLTNSLTGGEDPEYAENADARILANLELLEYGRQLASAKAKNPGDDLTSLLVREAHASGRVKPDEIASFFLLLAAAGHETTRNAIAHGMHLISTNPDQRGIWTADFDAVAPMAVDEILRIGSPITAMRRTALEDIEIDGQLIAAGDKVVLFYKSANMDEDVFIDPTRFDVRRAENPHMAFGGGGPHFCLGSHLAKMEMQVMFRGLFRRMPDIHVVGEPEYLQSTLINGIKRMKCAWS